MKVPILERQVRPVTGNVPAPAAPARPTPAAFGTPQAQAGVNMGSAINKIGEIVAQHAVRIQKRQDDKQVIANATAFQHELQNMLYDEAVDGDNGPKGFLNRSNAHASGITVQFDDVMRDLKDKYLGNVAGPAQKDELSKVLDSHYSTARSAVIRHEAQQAEADFKNVFNSQVQESVNAAALLTRPEDVQRAIATAQETAALGYRHMGFDAKTTELEKMKLAGDMVTAAVSSALDSDAKSARAIFDANKDKIPALTAAKLKTALEGKEFDDKRLAVWDQVKGFKLSDGNVDLEKAQAYVMGLNEPADKKEKLFSFVHSMASVSNAELRAKRDAADREFTNELLTQQAKGLPYQDALKMTLKYAYDPTDIAAKQKVVTDLYNGETTRFDTWLNKQPEATQAAWAYARETIQGKYGTTPGTVPGYPNKVKLADVAINELKAEALGKSPEEIRQLVNDKLAKVVIGPGTIWRNIWPEKGEAWKVDAGVRQGYAEAVLMLEKDYGAVRVSQARSYLIRNSIDVTPLNLKAALDKALKGDQR